ncbi:MAG: hypothetical protein ACHQUA_00685 [Microgenomates group bacterium]
MAEIKIGDLVGLDMSSNRARRIRVVVEINGNNAVVADGYGTHVAKITDLNISIPGFLEVLFLQQWKRYME